MNELNNLIDIKVDEIATAHPNYFPGQYLLAEDFNLEHKYLNDRLRYTNKSLHVSGIIEGLTVEKEGTNSVKITPGAAIDNQGNMIVIKEDTTFDGFNTINQGELYVKYIKRKDIQQQDNVIDSYTRWQEIPELGFADTTPETGVKLAQITLEEEAITKVDHGVREYSGLSLPTPEGGNDLTLRYGGRVNSINIAVLTGSLQIKNNLTVEGKMGIGTDYPRAMLDIRGNLKLQKGVAVNEISDDIKLTDVDSDQKIPTQRAIKNYIDREIGEAIRSALAGVYVKGMIMLWPVVQELTGSEFEHLPKGWKECDGEDGRPNINGRLVCGYSTREELDVFEDMMGGESNLMYYSGGSGPKTNYLYGRPSRGANDDVWEAWEGYRIWEWNLPNHVHTGKSTNGKWKDWKVMKMYENEVIIEGGRTAYVETYAENSLNCYRGDAQHDHEVTVGGRGEGNVDGGGEVRCLPRPPLIVLRYIIYWP